MMLKPFSIVDAVAAFQSGLTSGADDVATSATTAEGAIVSALEVYRQAHATATHQLETSLLDILRGHASKARALSEAAASGTILPPVMAAPAEVDLPAFEGELPAILRKDRAA